MNTDLIILLIGILIGIATMILSILTFNIVKLNIKSSIYDIIEKHEQEYHKKEWKKKQQKQFKEFMGVNR